MDLRDNISEHRRSAGFTQEDIANRLGVSRQTVGKWETGRAVPELEKLVALCNLFGCTLDELVGRVDAESHESLNDADLSTAAVEAAIQQEPCDSPANGEAHGNTGKLVKHAGILATGNWMILAAMGLLLLLFGPSSVDNIEVRKTVPYAVLFGVCLGVALIIAATKIGQGCQADGFLNSQTIRKWRAIAIAVAIAIVAIAYLLFSLAPEMRTIVFICAEIAALASWPIVFAIAVSKNTRG